jgi:hypothetical protein
MKSGKKNAVFLGGIVAVSAIPAIGLGAFLDNSITVGGNILAAPAWTDSAGLPVLAVSFAFSGVSSVPNSNVDSASQILRLQNAISYPASVLVRLPSSCKIGATTVAQPYVQLIMNGVLQPFLISIMNSSGVSFFIRFSSSGGYGDKSGTVICLKSGYLRYIY